MKKLILIIMVLAVLSMSIYGLFDTVSTFTGQTNPFNVTFTQPENLTYFIEVPIYGDIKNVSIRIEGVVTT